MDRTPAPCLPASVIPEGLTIDATANSRSRLQWQELQLGFVELEPLALVAEPVAAREQAPDDAHGLVLAVAEHHRIDAEGVRVGGQRTRSRAEDQPALALVIELHEALGDHEGMVVRQGDDAGAEADAMGPLGGRREEELRRGDDLPAGGVVFAAPEFVEAEAVEVLDELQVAAQLQRRMLADGMVGREEGAEFHVTHWVNPPVGATLVVALADNLRSAIRWLGAARANVPMDPSSACLRAALRP